MNKYIMRAILISLSIFNADLMAGQCKVISYEDNKTFEIKAAINFYTHIELPENIMQETFPIVGNPELWKSDHAGPHLFIKPTNSLPLGEKTSLSAVGESGKSYDFTVVRVKPNKLGSTCYDVKEGLIFSADNKALLSKKRGSASELATLWREKYEREKLQADDRVKIAVRDALRRYRYHIYTRYDWNQGSGFIGKNLISDVYDDGRFTYIRVNNQNKGILMVEAELGGQVEMIQADYDTINKMYTISGIFPKFLLKYADAKIGIERADNVTSGEY